MSVPSPPCASRDLQQLCATAGWLPRPPLQFMTQWIKNAGEGSCQTFWDLGSQVTLVTTQYAREQRLVGSGTQLSKSEWTQSGATTVKYKVEPVGSDRPWPGANCCKHGCCRPQDPLSKAFPEVPGEHKEGTSGRVGFMGQNNLRLFSIKEKRAVQPSLDLALELV